MLTFAVIPTWNISLSFIQLSTYCFKYHYKYHCNIASDFLLYNPIAFTNLAV